MGLLTNLLTRKEVKDKVKAGQNKIQEIYQVEEKIIKELKICIKISNHETTKSLVKLWEEEFKVLKGQIDVVESIEVDLDLLVDKNKFKKAIRKINETSAEIDQTQKDLIEFYEKLNKYTSFEHDSTKMSLNLKERLKSLNGKFDQNLKLFDVYTQNFIEKTSVINYKINEFEETQVRGDYTEARVFLKSGNEVLESLESQLNVLIENWQIYNALDVFIDKINSIELEIGAKGYEKYTTELKDKLQNLDEKKKIHEKELKLFNFNIETIETENIQTKELLKTREEIEKEFLELDREYQLILNIEKYKASNSNLLSVVQKLIDGAIEEKELIAKLYSLDETLKLTTIEDEKNLFEIFKSDYSKLENLILNENQTFVKLEQKAIQSNKYLNRVLEKINKEIKKLAAIRSDELEIREQTEYYSRELINIDLYLHQYDHVRKMSPGLAGNLKEFKIKLQSLIDYLDKDTLDISYVRAMNHVINRLYKKLITEIETDVKQRKGVEKLVVYFNKFIVNEEMLTQYQHFLRLYNEYEYKKILREMHKLLNEITSRGEELYKSIVGTIEVENYKRIK